MATVYGNIIANYWRSYCTYSTTSTATTYTVKAKTGVNCYKNGYKFNNWKSSLKADTETTYTNSSTTTWVGGTTGNNYSTIKDKNFIFQRKQSDYKVKVYYSTTNRYTGGSAPGTSSGSVTITIPALASYSINYNANAGEDIVEDLPNTQVKFYGIDLVLSSKTPTRTDYIFKGYSTTTDGDVSYQPSHNYTTNSELTLYAQWQLDAYTLKFNANGGSFTSPVEPQTINAGEEFDFSTISVPTRKNYYFLGWSSNSKATTVEKDSGAVYAPTASITWYAVWKSRYTPSIIQSLVSMRTNDEFIEDSAGESAKIQWVTKKGTWLEDDFIEKTTVNTQFRIDIKDDTDNIIFTTDFTSSPLLIPSSSCFFESSKQYTVILTVADINFNTGAVLGTVVKVDYISVASFIIDVSADGTAICFFGEAPDDKDGLFLKDDTLEAELTAVLGDIGV